MFHVERREYNALITRWRINPEYFAKTALNVDLEDWQVEMMDAIADLDRAKYGIPTKLNHELKLRFSIASMHGAGKSFFLCVLIVWFQFTRIGRIALTGPTEASLTKRTMPTLSAIISGAHDFVRENSTVDTLQAYFFNDVHHNVVVATATHADNLAGFHHKNMMFLIDEASAVNEAMFPVISGALSTEGAVLVMIGNPTMCSGEFYRSHKDHRSKDLYYTKSIKFNETSRISQKWVNQMRARYGETSPVYRIRVLGEFVESSANQLLAIDWLRQAHGKQVDTTNLTHLVLSCDVAAGGIDNTVIIAADVSSDHVHVQKMYQYNFDQTVAVAETRRAVQRVFDNHNQDQGQGDYIVIDANGVGDGAGAELVLAGYPVVRYKGGSKSDDAKRWRNRRVQSYLRLRDALRDGHISFAADFCSEDDWLELINQAATILMVVGNEAAEDLETKHKMLSRGLKSPDMIDALSMLFATQDVAHKPIAVDTFGATNNHMDEEF